jgi:hypothetical protein
MGTILGRQTPQKELRSVKISDIRAKNNLYVQQAGNID